MVERIPSAGKLQQAVTETGSKKPNSAKAGELSFQEMLQQEQSREINLSAHARERMESRDINLAEQDWEKISQAVDRAEEKGVRSSLLLYGDVALVASINNRTIITALDQESSKDHVFTGIDGAVVVE